MILESNNIRKGKEIFVYNNVVIFNVFGVCYIFGLNSLTVYKAKINNSQINDLIQNKNQKNLKDNNISFLLNNDSEFNQILKIENRFEKNLFIPNSNKIDNFFGNEIESLVLIISQSCNMRCKYCYVSDWTEKNELMDFETAKKSIELAINNTEKENIVINYFGGEPLLNFDVLRKATIFAENLSKKKGKKISFALVTNGTIINQEIIDFFKNYNFGIGISLDGPKHIHDSLRVYPNGDGTYNTIIENIEKYYSTIFANNDICFHVALHYPFYKEVSKIYDFFVSMEDKYNIRFNPFGKISYVDSRELFKETKEHFDEFIEMKYLYFKKVFEECIRAESTEKMFHKNRINFKFLKILDEKKMKKSACGSGISSIFVLPNGDIGGCSQIIPQIFPKAIWGNIHTGIENISNDIKLLPYKGALEARKKCKDCWLRNVCAGSCPALNYYYNKDMSEPDIYQCEIIKTEFMLSVWLKDKLKEAGLWKSK